MAKKKTPYLDFYRDHIAEGVMPMAGLCYCFEGDPLELFAPEGKVGCYWAFDGENDYWAIDHFNDRVITNCFSPLRQNIVLLMAAMNNEL